MLGGSQEQAVDPFAQQVCCMLVIVLLNSLSASVKPVVTRSDSTWEEGQGRGAQRRSGLPADVNMRAATVISTITRSVMVSANTYSIHLPLAFRRIHTPTIPKIATRARPPPRPRQRYTLFSPLLPRRPAKFFKFFCNQTERAKKTQPNAWNSSARGQKCSVKSHTGTHIR